MVSGHSNALILCYLLTCPTFYLIAMTPVIIYGPYGVCQANTITANIVLTTIFAKIYDMRWPLHAYSMHLLCYITNTLCDSHSNLQKLIISYSSTLQRKREDFFFLCYKRNPSALELPFPHSSASGLVHPIQCLNIRWCNPPPTIYLSEKKKPHILESFQSLWLQSFCS